MVGIVVTVFILKLELTNSIFTLTYECLMSMTLSWLNYYCLNYFVSYIFISYPCKLLLSFYFYAINKVMSTILVSCLSEKDHIIVIMVLKIFEKFRKFRKQKLKKYKNILSTCFKMKYIHNITTEMNSESQI